VACELLVCLTYANHERTEHRSAPVRDPGSSSGKGEAFKKPTLPTVALDRSKMLDMLYAVYPPPSSPPSHTRVPYLGGEACIWAASVYGRVCMGGCRRCVCSSRVVRSSSLTGAAPAKPVAPPPRSVAAPPQPIIRVAGRFIVPG
jgi:hypothetical protein